MPPNRRRRHRPNTQPKATVNPHARTLYERGLYNGPARFVRDFLDRAGIEHAIPDTLPRERKAESSEPKEG
jgi:hypothetical protein